MVDRNQKEVWVVDLDHTLVKTDTGVEGFLKFLTTHPLAAFLALGIFFRKGLGAFKKEVCTKALVDIRLLPYRWDLIEILKKAKSNGHQLVLATASHEITALAVNRHLELFDQAIGTVDQNIKGAAKTQAIRKLLGDQPYLYWGDSDADYEVWEGCARVGVVNPSDEKLFRLMKSRSQEDVLVFRDAKVPFGVLFKATRVYQWSKNLLVFLPILGAHLILDADALFSGFLAALAFSFVASAIYLLNDIADLESDRKHDTKKNRPFASGALNLEKGLLGVAVFLLGGFGIGLFLPESFFSVLFGYFVLTCFYSFWLKKVVLVDVVILALLYTFRVFAGGAAVGVTISHWLLVFSFFFFFSLAFVKRYVELKNHSAFQGRGYQSEDRQIIFTLGISSGLISVLVFSLFIFAPEIASIYPKHQYLGLAVPLLFFWVSRVWFLAERGKVFEDPVIFALKDKTSYGVGILFLILLFLASRSDA